MREHISYVARAIEIAMKAHMGQKYGSYPYTKHLADVAMVLSRFDIYHEKLHAAAWLHDVLEDTTVEHNKIVGEFGRIVYGIILAVTDESGANRKERHLKTYPKIQKNERAITIKLADRIANVEESIKINSNLLKMYRKEYGEFREALYAFSTYEHTEMWRWLDEHLGEKSAIELRS